MNIKEIYLNTRDKYQLQIGRKQSLENQLTKNELRIKEIDKLMDLYQNSSLFLQKTSEVVRTRKQHEIEGTVTKGLMEILDNSNLKFKVIFDNKRNVNNAYFRIYDSLTDETFDILNSFGGGIADIVAIVIRILFLYYSGMRKILILDETGKFVSNSHQGNLSKFLKKISEKLDIQIVLISHKEQIIENAHKVIKIKKEKDKSIVE